ncbi:MAG: PAS domain S-box protein [Candidatus Hydrogenedentes bacterium]|nr:PAS domain S-box protein [Candidatus Hydrogenedentota bacterium]
MKNASSQVRDVADEQQSALHALRLVMVNRSLWVIVVLAGILQIVAGVEEIQRGRYGLVVFYVGLYILLILTAVKKSLPYILRALSAPVIFYLVAVSELLYFTIVSNALLYLFSFVILTGIFVGFRSGLLALAVSGATLAIFAWAYTAGILPAEPQPAHLLLSRPELSRDVLNWLTMGVPFVFVSGAILACLTAMLRALITKTDEAEKLVRHLSEEIEERRAATLERETALAALRESEATYKMLADNVRDVIWTADLTGKFTYVSPSVERMRGYTPAEIVTGGMVMSVPPEDTGVFVEAIGEELSLEETGGADPDRARVFLLKSSHKDGSTIDTEVLVSFLRDASGVPCGILGVTRDITERKRAEEALRIIFDNNHDALFLHAADGKILDVNNKMLDMYGVTHELASTLSIQDDYTADDWPTNTLSETWEAVMAGEAQLFEWKARRPKDASTFYVEVALQRIQIHDELLVLANVRDISERKRVAMEKEKLEEQYRQAQKVDAIGRLAGGVAHDLNNLLTPILGYGEMLRDECDLHEEQRDFVAQIVLAAEGARDLVGQLLAFGRKQTLQYTILDVNETIKGIEKLLRRTLRDDIEFGVLPGLDLPPVKADMRPIEQFVMNLVVNAQDAMPEGGRLTVETGFVALDESSAGEHVSVSAGRYVVIAISDTGDGMDEGTRSLIFDPFFSTKGEQGTGLGLATVFGIVNQHGGSILVDSEPGRGTMFKVYLPVSAEPCAEVKRIEVDLEDLCGSETILLAEDNAEVRSLAHALLERQGYTVFVAESGPEALRVLAGLDKPVHLLVTDVVMPEMSGKDLSDKVAREHPHMKVLYMSGYANDVISRKGVLEEGVAFIQKPFSLQTLASKVREVLRQG